MMGSECLMGPCPLKQLSTRSRCLWLLALLKELTVALWDEGGTGVATCNAALRPWVGWGDFLFSVGYPYAYTTLPPFIHGPCLAPPLLWNLPGPLSNREVWGGESWLHTPQGQ